MTRTKWNGKDWREFTCRECGYWDIEGFYDQNSGFANPLLPGCKNGYRVSIKKACPEFEPRDIPDPEFPDERTNLSHIREEDRNVTTD